MERLSNFPEFLKAMGGKYILHLGHRDADCDAMACAYAMSRILPGDVGFAQNVKDSAQNLARWLDFEYLIDPDPADYDYTIIYDTISLNMLGMPLPARYALFDHHESGGHRYSTLRSELAGDAEWAWVYPVDSTCSILIDLFASIDLQIDKKTAVALATGIVTDTARLRLANGGAIRRLGSVLEPHNLYIDDVMTVFENPDLRMTRNRALLDAMQGLKETACNGWQILSTEISTQEYAFILLDVLHHVGDVIIVSFPKNGMTMVMAECASAIVQTTDIDMAGLMKSLREETNTGETWGTRALGRIIAPLPPRQLMDICMRAVKTALLHS